MGLAHCDRRAGAGRGAAGRDVGHSGHDPDERGDGEYLLDCSHRLDDRLVRDVAAPGDADASTLDALVLDGVRQHAAKGGGHVRIELRAAASLDFLHRH